MTGTRVTSAKADTTSNARRGAGTGLQHVRVTTGNLAAVVGNGC